MGVKGRKEKKGGREWRGGEKGERKEGGVTEREEVHKKGRKA